MTLPGAAEIDRALQATWPAARVFRDGSLVLRDGAGGGQRDLTPEGHGGTVTCGHPDLSEEARHLS